MATGFVQCADCRCLLREVDGPLCASCEDKRRSEAAKKAAETRAEHREEAEAESE